jgi:hypothetical protein
MARRHPDLVPVTIEKVRYGFTVDGIICEYAQGRAPDRRLERAPGQTDADVVLADHRRRHHRRLLVPVGALPCLPHHERDRPAHARSTPRGGREQSHSVVVLPIADKHRG